MHRNVLTPLMFSVTFYMKCVTELPSFKIMVSKARVKVRKKMIEKFSSTGIIMHRISNA